MTDRVVDLTFGVAQVTVFNNSPQLHIMIPASREAASYEPAESVTIHGKPAIDKLRIFLNQLEMFND